MSRNYRFPEYHPYEMQAAAGHHFSYMPLSQPMTNPSATPAYEMTAASAGGACEGALPSASPTHPLSDPRKRRHFSATGDTGECYEPCDGEPSDSDCATRKRKTSSYGTASAYDDDTCDDSHSSRASTVPDKKQNHSEIEKRRRDKMNTYITELSAMIPMCGAMARKLDKLTVLRMAVQHLRTVRGSLSACPLSARPRPSFVTEPDLNALLLQAAQDSFLIVVGCDRGRLLYVSQSVTRMLHFDQSELLGQSMFDILHPKDVAKVKEQLSSSDLNPRERLIDAKTMLPVKSDAVLGASRLCPGARRSFFCRIKCKQSHNARTPVKEEVDPANKHRKKHERKYCVVQCTGYLKSWAPAEIENGCSEADEEHCNVSCLVAVGRALPEPATPAPPAPPARAESAPSAPPPPPPPPPIRHLQYVSRHATDGKFLFVDQRVTLALGFLPQELLGTSLYEYVSGPELGSVARTHKQALLRRDALHTPPYSFRRKDGTHATIQTHFKPFRNPWTKDMECLVANNTIVSDTSPPNEVYLQYDAFNHAEEWHECLTTKRDAAERQASPGGGVSGGDVGGIRAGGYVSEGDAEVQRLIESQVESNKIGNAIAEEALRRSPPHTAFSPLPHDLLADPVFNPSSLVDNILGADVNYTVRNNVPLSAAAGGSSPGAGEGAASGSPSPSPLPGLTLDGNGEAAMAVIMSLLEADAGLGGPVNFSGLPWPLP